MREVQILTDWNAAQEKHQKPGCDQRLNWREAVGNDIHERPMPQACVVWNQTVKATQESFQRVLPRKKQKADSRANEPAKRPRNHGSSERRPRFLSFVLAIAPRDG